VTEENTPEANLESYNIFWWREGLPHLLLTYQLYCDGLLTQRICSVQINVDNSWSIRVGILLSGSKQILL